MLTVREVHGKALVDTPADKLSKVKAETVAYTLAHVKPEALLDSLAHTLGKVEVKKHENKLCDFKVLALVDELAYMLPGKDKKTYAVTPKGMWSLRLW